MDSLVSTQWLAQHLGDGDVQVVDASLHLPNTGRDARAEFLDGHIPGARFLDLASLIDDQSDVPQALPRAEQMEQRLAALGLRRQDRIIFYDNSAIKSSARAWYLCRAFGISNIAIVDGGYGKWVAEGRGVERGEVERGEADQAMQPAINLSPAQGIFYKSDILANLQTKQWQLIDARDNARFTGEFVDHIHNMPSGHIPGSCNLPFTQLFNPDGTYKSLAELRAQIIDAGIGPDQPVIASCGSGVTACVLLFALHRIGAPTIALYDGSWIDWGADPDTPKAKSVCV